MDAKWIGIGLAFGLVVGIATENLGLWLGVGIALGAAFGAYQAKKKSPPPSLKARDMTWVPRLGPIRPRVGTDSAPRTNHPPLERRHRHVIGIAAHV